MIVRFQDFSTYHGKFPATGSTQIRVHQLIKYWEEADVYKYGENPDVLIFQKVYCSPDYKFPKHYPKLKILDVCDPDWLNGLTLIKETVDAVHAVTCSSDALTSFIQQLTDKPVITIPDRFDLDVIPRTKKHEGDTKTVVWFGYRHNAETIKSALNTIRELGLKLIVVADDDPLLWQWLPKNVSEEFRQDKYEYIRYEEDRIYTDLKRAEVCVLPDGIRPAHYFKSNNKTVKAILAGLPVAKNSDELKALIKAGGRQKFLDDNYKKTAEDYCVEKSVQQYKDLINSLTL